MKIYAYYVPKKRLLGIILLAALAVAACLIGFNAGSVAVSGTARKIPIYSVYREDKVLAISFDAAWGDEDTPEIIRILSEYNVKATFFVVGDWVDKYPHQVKALFEAGHEVMNHSNTHPYMTKLSLSDMALQLSRCSDKIAAITGVSPTLFRAPYGDYSNSVLEAALSEGMLTIQWDVDSLDWKNLTAGQIYNRVVPKVKSGSIVLFHNGGLHTAESLPSIISELQRQGYKFLKISELVYFENYTVDHTGKQIPNK
jgi:polysaccharide deacetylase family sporulation protein PdaB